MTARLNEDLSDVWYCMTVPRASSDERKHEDRLALTR